MIQWFQELLKLKEIYIFMLAGLVLFPFIGNEAFAQESQSLTITTLKESYAAGEPVEITGLVETKVGDEIVTLRIFNPMNTLIAIDNIIVNDDGTFSVLIPTSIGGQWAKDGTYTIIANYYASTPATTQFEYGGMISAGIKSIAPEVPTKEDIADSESLMLEDHELKYELTGAKIIRITPDFEMKSLIIEIETYSDGELRITFPKDVIHTDEEGFFVLVDGEETNHEAVFDNDNWSFVIPFSNGSQEIEIIGTYVIPEFGTVALLILVIAISTIVVISTKNRQIFYPNT